MPGDYGWRGERDAERELRRHQSIQSVERVGRLQRDRCGRIANSDRNTNRHCDSNCHCDRNDDGDADGDADAGNSRQAQRSRPRS